MAAVSAERPGTGEARVCLSHALSEEICLEQEGLSPEIPLVFEEPSLLLKESKPLKVAEWGSNTAIKHLSLTQETPH